MDNEYQYINLEGKNVFHRFCKSCFNWIPVKKWKGQFRIQGNTCGECRSNKKSRQPISVKLRFAVFTRDNFTCQYCGQSAPKVKLHLDHIQPVSKGGDNCLDNLITACQDCNLGKSNIIICRMN